MADACRIVEVLGRHALAITQAGAFVKRKFCSLKEYPERFQQHRRTLLEFFPRQAQSTYQNVYATFDVSARFLANSGQQKHLRALQLLKILGFMHFNQVSESIFTRAAKHISKVLAANRDGESFAQLYSWHMERVPSAILPKAILGGLNTFVFCEARDTLASLSLVKISGAEHEMSMHPLVHVWVRDRMQDSPAALRAEWERAAVILALSTEESSSYQNYFPSLDIHITACLGACPTEIMATPPSNTGYAHLFYRLGYTQIFNDSTPRSVRDAFYGYINNFSLSERNAVQCKRIIASYLIKENNTLAAAMLEEVVRFETSILSDDNYDKITTQYTLARALMEVGENARAIELLEEVVRICSLTLPEDHRDRLLSQCTLARALMEISEYTRAIELLEEVVRIEASTLPKNDRARLTSQHELAIALMEISEYTRAIELLEEVVRIEASTLPKNDRARLTSQHELAIALMEISEYTRAIELLEEVVRIEASTLPKNDRARLTSQHELARALIDVGENARAIELLEEVVQIRSSTLPKDHRERLVSQYELARALIDVGENARAIELLEEVVQIRSSTPPKDHRERLVSQHLLARAVELLQRGSAD
jgi:tetratricopeptide (TPR) repeat protein